jgi:hypothetical protein
VLTRRRYRGRSRWCRRLAGCTGARRCLARVAASRKASRRTGQWLSASRSRTASVSIVSPDRYRLGSPGISIK